MVEEMTDKELITVTIDRYTDLQQIKKANGGHENEMLDCFIKVTTAKLSSLGVNVEDITLKWKTGKRLMTKKELLQNSLDKFMRIQKYLRLIQDKDSDIYKEIKQRYNELKVILNSISDFDLSVFAELDEIKE